MPTSNRPSQMLHNSVELVGLIPQGELEVKRNVGIDLLPSVVEPGEVEGKDLRGFLHQILLLNDLLLFASSAIIVPNVAGGGEELLNAVQESFVVENGERNVEELLHGV